jgi:hypothetical protein
MQYVVLPPSYQLINSYLVVLLLDGTHLVLAAATTDTSRGKFDVTVADDAVVNAENNFGGVAEASSSVACRAITNPPQHNSSSSSDDGNLLTFKVDVIIIFCCRTHNCSAHGRVGVRNPMQRARVVGPRAGSIDLGSYVWACMCLQLAVKRY